MPETSNLPVNIELYPCHLHNTGHQMSTLRTEIFRRRAQYCVFLYGIFFLVGKEIGYAGITCPKCLNTIYHQNSKEAILALKKMLSDMICLGNSTFDPQLRYYSSLGGSPKDISLIGAFKHPLFRTRIGLVMSRLHYQKNKDIYGGKF